MTKANESGHSKVVATLIEYNDFLNSLGAAYNPSLQQINLVSFGTLCTTAGAKLAAVHTASEAWKTDTNNREAAFADLGAFCTRLLAALRATTAMQQTVDDLSALVKKVRGNGKAAAAAKQQEAAANAEAPAKATRSTSQQSYDLRLDNFSKIIMLLRNVPDYAPNEPEISITGLQAHYFKLNNLNSLVSKSSIALRRARDERDEFFYTPETGLVDLVKKSKAYILSVYGRSNKIYTQAATFRITAGGK